MKDFNQIVEWVCREDARYQHGAYHFVREGLDFTLQRMAESGQEPRHISGQELLDGLRAYALEQYGPLAYILLQDWGVRRCEDFGEIVFNLVDCGALGKTEEDSREDFTGGYDFEAAFVQPFARQTRQLASRG